MDKQEPFETEIEAGGGQPKAVAALLESVAKTLRKFDDDRRVDLDLYVEELEEPEVRADGGNILRACDECGALLPDGDNIELSSGTYCKPCAAGREEEPIRADGGVDEWAAVCQREDCAFRAERAAREEAIEAALDHDRETGHGPDCHISPRPDDGVRTDGGQPAKEETEVAQECSYCGTTELAYQLESDRGTVVRCIECLAIEQIQQQFSLPFEAWLDRDDIEPPDHPDAPDIEPFDPREHDYMTARAWATILARLKDDDPIVKRDPDAIGTIFEDTREFLTNVMGADAHKRPSELRGETDE